MFARLCGSEWGHGHCKDGMTRAVCRQLTDLKHRLSTWAAFSKPLCTKYNRHWHKSALFYIGATEDYGGSNKRGLNLLLIGWEDKPKQQVFYTSCGNRASIGDLISLGELVYANIKCEIDVARSCFWKRYMK